MAVIMAASRATPPLLLLTLVVFAALLAAAAAAAADASAGGTGAPSTTTFVLAGERTRRKDPLDGLRLYAGGWNISDEHYWASVGFTAAPVFAAAGIWFVVLGIALLLAGRCFCCCPGRGGGGSYSCTALVVSLVLLLAFTAAAAIGCAVLYDGQGRFHGSTTATVDYVAGQSGDAVASLRGFASSMESAKAVGVGPVSLPANVKGRIDGVVRKVSSAADELAARTASNAAKIRAALETIRKILIVVAATMLILAVIGLAFSICGMESLVYVLVFVGWILVTATILLCGTFLLLHNVVGDTCAAMGEWMLLHPQPQARTALDDILPCVDTAAAADALARSKEVTYQLVAVLNGVIANVSNADGLPPQAAPLYYNQSGPPVPLLCSPYAADLTATPGGCAAGEVDLASAPRAWAERVCRTHAVASPGSSSSEVCATVGRLTPAMYAQMVAAANVSDGLSRYGPVLADMADCTFVRRAFRAIGDEHCPGLGRYSGQVYRGLLAVAGAVLVTVVLWVVHSRERRRRSDAMELRAAASPYTLHHSHMEEGALLKSPRMMYR
ncbi:uncharacterized protein LOC102704951 [Oryza brachyantha]|uniref:uncharacterized protein LOC102704951 n=1 Tax=Oryza brachyantha TaxID=4533 RepID=UPI001ADBDEC2|nr:uncharacterized protein LOC102704951 [Oryza brachyantha]